jgi:hypothetical protein
MTSQLKAAEDSGSGPGHRHQLLPATVRSNGMTGAAFKQFMYGYDKAGNQTSEQIDLGVTGASYNNVNQLATAAGGRPVRFLGHLDGTGHRADRHERHHDGSPEHFVRRLRADHAYGDRSETATRASLAQLFYWQPEWMQKHDTIDRIVYGLCLSKKNVEICKYRKQQPELPRTLDCIRWACGIKCFIVHEKPFILSGHSCDADNRRRCSVCFAEPAVCKLDSFAN